MVFYNEHDAFAASWLRELMKEGVIALGEVDERSIEDVQAADLKGFAQCHFFAGIGVWSYALKQAGWADDSAVWTGSCPCQSFSASGKRGGFSDKRHLWPAWFRLIRECSPDIVFGEQVASKDGLAWFDVVSSDLEGAGYALGAADTCAAGFGAPHIRQRLYFVADAGSGERNGNSPIIRPAISREAERNTQEPESQRSSAASRGLADSSRRPLPDERRGTERRDGIDQPGEAGELGHAQHIGHDRPQGEPAEPSSDRQERGLSDGAGLTNGFWRDSEWLWCRDQKYRPTQPGLFPLASRIANRVGTLRGAGNALTAPQAQGFIEAYLESCHAHSELYGLGTPKDLSQSQDV